MTKLHNVEKMFMTYGENGEGYLEYYRVDDGFWYVQSTDKEIIRGFKCIGSIDITRNPAFERVVHDEGEIYGKIVRRVYEEMKKGPPAGFTPCFVKDNCPLNVNINGPENGILLGNEITDVYKLV